MAYFNHAFHKILLGTKTAADAANGWYTGAAGTLTSPAGLASGVIGAFAINGTLGNHYQLDGNAAAPTLAQAPMIYLAQGSINTKDKLGPFHGGFKETVKTKYINPRYVTKFYKQSPISPTAAVTTVCLCTGDLTGALPQCGTSYYLRIDVKGSPALRFLTHNAYRTYASSNVCCPADPNDPTNIDPMAVIASWAYQILRDPIMSKFIAPGFSWAGDSWTYSNVAAWWAANPNATEADLLAEIVNQGWDGGIADTDPCLVLTGSYADTTFGTCSFHPQDHYELEPIKIYASITDQLGDPCVDQVWCTTQTVQPAQGSNYGHRYLRDLILFRRYMGENYVYDPRLREVMDQDVITNSGITPTAQYKEYGILHSVPRFNNPTGTFDNDQYLITIIFPNAATTTDFETWMSAYIALGGNGVTLETI